MTLTDAARKLLGNMGYDPTYGARPLRRVIQKQLTDRLALALLEGELREGDSVVVDAVGGELVLETAAAAGGRCADGQVATRVAQMGAVTPMSQRPLSLHRS